MNKRLGLLRCLLHYPFYPFWKRFFEELGFTTVLSPAMTGDRFDRGRRWFVGDICLPIESAFYHAEAIKGDVDAVFIPFLGNIHRDVYICPAYASLPALIRNIIVGLPPTLSTGFTPFSQPSRNDFALLKRFGCRPAQVRAAHAAACRAYAEFVEASRNEPVLDRAMARAVGEPAAATAAPADGPHLLLLGMPYVLGDTFVNQGIPDMLARRGCRLTTPLMVAPEMANRELTVEDYPIYWTFASMSIAAMARFLGHVRFDGVVYCTSFACGVDSLITPIVESACRRCYDMPLLVLVADEHAEAANMEMRVEAFLDCLESRRRQGVKARE